MGDFPDSEPEDDEDNNENDDMNNSYQFNVLQYKCLLNKTNESALLIP